MTAWVLHVDLDQFLAAVEVLRHPELAGKPVVVSGRGDPTERGVVSTASYEARAFGVHSGMPLRIAARKCPEAVFLPVDRPVYEAASEQVMATLREVPGATVAVLGWDEAFVGLDTEEPEEVARRLRAAVLERTGLHCSVGIGDTTVRAKNATDLGKPQHGSTDLAPAARHDQGALAAPPALDGPPARLRTDDLPSHPSPDARDGDDRQIQAKGTFTLTRENWIAVMGERPATDLWGIGRRVGARLATHGIVTVTDLARADLDLLQAEFGPRMGPHYAALGRGAGATTVDDTPWVPRAHGRETTYQQDLTGRADIDAALLALAEQVVADLEREGRPCQRVHLKVRFAPFFTVQRSRKLPEPTLDPGVVAAAAGALLDGLEDDRPVRLLGIRGEMVPPEGGY